MNALFKVWHEHPKYQLPDTNYHMIGYSIAALRTSFYVEELDIYLDAGLSGYMSPECIFITHAHGDHIANIPFLILSAKAGKPIKIFYQS